MVGRVIGWVLLAILLLIIVLIVLPISLQIEYKAKKLVVKVRVLFIRLRLFPQKEKTEQQKQQQELKKEQSKEKKKAKQASKDKKAAKTDDEEEKEKKPKRKKTLEEWILLGQQLVGSGVKGGKFIFKHIHLKDVEIILPIYDEDASQTALKFAKAQGIMASAYALLQNFTHITYKRLAAIPDFLNQYEEQTTFSCKIEASPIIMIIGAIIAIKQYFAYKRQQKENYRLAAKEIVLERRAAAQKNRQRKKEELEEIE